MRYYYGKVLILTIMRLGAAFNKSEWQFYIVISVAHSSATFDDEFLCPLFNTLGDMSKNRGQLQAQ